MSSSPSISIPDHSIQIAIDRGGTFTDCHASWPTEGGRREEIVVKLLSVDLANYPDAPTEGIRRILQTITKSEIPRGNKLDTTKIDFIRLSTTVATNALLERKGTEHAFLVTKGFKDLLIIGNQSRPNIFALKVQRTKPLFQSVVEIDERVTLVGFTSDLKFAQNAIVFDEDGKVVGDHSGEIVRGISGEGVRILKKPDESRVRADLKALYDKGIRCLAICFAHSYTFPDHELLVASIAREIGFTHISVSSQVSAQIKMVPRATSSTADAYLTPVLQDYISSFFKGFDENLGKTARVEFMTSEGSLVEVDKFFGLRSILSGPAGGVVAYSQTSWDDNVKMPLIGFDMGGTSTDVSRYDGRYEMVYETTTAGISIQSAQLDINTVAAGGGSCLSFRNGLFNVGPESAGAEPGPACYRKGGLLATTDANLVLGRLLPDYFPKIFGKSEDQPLDRNASIAAFEVLRKQIDAASSKPMTLDEVAYGFVKIANEKMARPIRTLTEARGFALGKHILASFGGAGGQHACELARSLGMSKILIHRFSSILSAYGMALADRAFEKQEPCSSVYSNETKSHLLSRIERLRSEVVDELKRQGFSEDRIVTECYLNMRYDGSDTSLMTLAPKDGSFDFQRAFEEAYQKEFGFLLEEKSTVVDDVRVRGIGKSIQDVGESVFAECNRLTFTDVTRLPERRQSMTSMYFEQAGRIDVPVFLLEKLNKGDLVNGPAAIVDGTQTLILDPASEAKICSRHVYISLH
ncbi:5-oxoprolinase [Moniliophthora roreri MCA 2997]|uniref:5-oxoprolinase n=1 Tax=Moniliophthora roreri (strain MCA 2997) TaxID=1381753 RepID=V2XZZ8_MONRO|nr:5-oxoprolinase [Moniliophthora roreri MCA 2997]